MKKIALLGFLTLALVLSSGCGDEKRTEYGWLVVEVNTPSAEYDIFKCTYGEAIESGSGQDEQSWFHLPECDCYEVVFYPDHGIDPPEKWEGKLKSGDEVYVEGLYESYFGEATLRVKGNIDAAKWWVTNSNGQTVQSGPSQWGHGQDADSYQLDAYSTTPSYIYTVHCSEVSGYNPQPVEHYVELIVGQVTEVTCMYNETGPGSGD